MSVNYDLYETPNPDKEGEVLPLHARVVLKGSYTAEEIADQVVAFQRMPHAQVVGIIEAISKELRHLLFPFRVKNPCINRQDYASLVGKTKTQALKDINTFIGQGILRKYGTGRSVVYIKAE